MATRTIAASKLLRTIPIVFVATCPECGAPLMPTSGRLALVECGACGWLDLDEDELSDMLAYRTSTYQGVRLC